MHEGAVLAGKYRLISLLGRGGMGSVWRAQHLDLDAPVAIKLVDPALVGSGEGIARFHREAQAAATLRSPHVVQILDRGVDETTSQPFIVMELMEGESLAGRLGRVGSLSPAQTADVVTQIARALTRAHEAGIVHRDLKPDNVFLVRNEDAEVAKVLDFGIAKSERHRLDDNSATRTGAVMGTPYYMSPEQISGSKGIDFRTDLWALAVIACECLTGRRPFDAESIGGLALKICAEPLPRPSLFAQVPPAFDAWLERALSRDPNQRFQSARELAEELRRVCGAATTGFGHGMGVRSQAGALPAETTGAVARTNGPPVDGLPKKSRAPLIALAVVLVAGAGAAAFALATREPAPPPAESASAATPPTTEAAPPPPPPAEPAPPVPSPEATAAPAASASVSAPPDKATDAASPAATSAPRPRKVTVKAPPPAPKSPAPAKTSGFGSALDQRR